MIPLQALRTVLAHEGGIADVGDGKGTTYFGQTPEWLRQWQLPTPDTPEAALTNYATWLQRSKLDRLTLQDDRLSTHFVDFAVHSGDSAAIRGLQVAVQVPADGILGPVTLSAIDRQDRDHLARRLFAYRLRLCGKLLARPENRRFASGWLNRLAALALV